MKTMSKKEISRRGFIQLAGFTLGATIFSRPCLSQAQQARMLSIATGGTGGVFYVIGGAIANTLNKHIPNTKVTAEVTAGVIDNIKLLGARKVELALLASDNAYEAYIGGGVFKTKIPMRTLLVLWSNYFHFVVREGTDINSVRDLRGKRVSLGSPGSGSEVKGSRLLEVFGIDSKKDITLDRLSVAESAGAMKDRKLDAFYFPGGLPAPAILDLAATPGIKIKLLDLGESVSKMRGKWGPVYFGTLIPKGTYPGIDYDVNTLAAGTILCCLDEMDKDLTYQITKVIIEDRSEIILVHKEAESISLQNAVIGSPIPYHPGAIGYYKEKGMAIKP